MERSILRLFRDGWLTIGPDRRRLQAAIVNAFAMGILETALLYLIARLAILLTTRDESIQVSVAPLPAFTMSPDEVIAIAVVLGITLIALSIPLSSSLATVSSRAIVRMRENLVDGYMRATWAHQSEQREAYLAQLAGEYCQRAESAVQNMTTVMVSAATMSVVFVGLVVTSPVLSSFGLIGLAVVALCVRPWTRRVKANSVANALANLEFVSRTSQVSRLAAEISAFNVASAASASLSAEARGAASRLWAVRFTSRLVPGLFQYVGLLIVLVLVAGTFWLAPGSSYELAPMLLLLVRQLTYVRQLLTATQAGNELAPYIESVHAALAELRANAQRFGAAEISRFDSLEVRSVSYGYPGGSSVLRDVSMTVDAGAVLGVVGPSGGGKSTLVQLLLRLRQPDTGAIYLDGEDIQDIDADCWSSLVAHVPQENKLVYGTVADNIRFFRQGRSDDDVQRAARAAHLHDELTALPERYDTLIGPGARDLSGGQRQRLGIARALLGMPRLLVLDEPTSALDERSEILIRQTLTELRGSTTIVLVAHRPATLKVCDRAIRVVSGQVHEVDPTAFAIT